MNELKTEPLRELNTFLEEENKGYRTLVVETMKEFHNGGYKHLNMVPLDEWLQDHNTRLVNKVLEIVKKGIKEKKFIGNSPEKTEMLISVEEVETLLNNLTI